MKPLRILSNLTDIQEYDSVALSAVLRCSCGGTVFDLSHTGRQTKGILAPLILPRNGQLCVMGRCLACGTTICIYDSRIDGSRPKEAVVDPSVPLATKQGTEWQVTLRFNYFPESLCTETGLYSNHFENLLADIRKPTPSSQSYTLIEI